MIVILVVLCLSAEEPRWSMRVVAEAGGPSLAGAPRRLAATGFATAMLLSLVLTLHVLYDSAALYTLDDSVVGDPDADHLDPQLFATLEPSAIDADQSIHDFPQSLATANDIGPPDDLDNNISNSATSSRVHFPRTSRRLPQVPIFQVSSL